MKNARLNQALVVDDDPLVRSSLRRTLKERATVVTTARDGEEAWGFLESTSFELLLSDVDMPGLGGLGLLQLVRARWPDLPMILLTGDPTSERALLAIEYGATAYLNKPFTRLQVLDVIDRVLGEKRDGELLSGTGSRTWVARVLWERLRVSHGEGGSVPSYLGRPLPTPRTLSREAGVHLRYADHEHPGRDSRVPPSGGSSS